MRFLERRRRAPRSSDSWRGDAEPQEAQILGEETQSTKKLNAFLARLPAAVSSHGILVDYFEDSNPCGRPIGVVAALAQSSQLSGRVAFFCPCKQSAAGSALLAVPTRGARPRHALCQVHAAFFSQVLVEYARTSPSSLSTVHYYQYTRPRTRLDHHPGALSPIAR